LTKTTKSVNLILLFSKFYDLGTSMNRQPVHSSKIEKKGLSREQEWEKRRDRECTRLSREIRAINAKIEKLNRDRTNALRYARQFNHQAGRLAQEKFNNQRISFAIAAAGAAISGGMLGPVLTKIGDALGLVSMLFGGTPDARAIEQMFNQVDLHMRRFNELGDQINYFERGLRGYFQKRNVLKCANKFGPIRRR
jgi:hypothetical protein